MVDPARELVDVIDADGKTIGVTTRREMRVGRLPHRCAYVLVFNTRGDLFVHLRTASKDVYPSHWDICIGGVLTAGENFDPGAIREVREELGIEAKFEPLFPFRYFDDKTEVHGHVYRLIHDGPFHLQVEEIVRGEFSLIAEVLSRVEREPFCPDGVEVLKRYLREFEANIAIKLNAG